MLVICTVLAMAAPSLKGFFASRRGADAAATLVALTGYARSQAISEGRTYRMNVDSKAGTYFLTAQNGGTYGAPHTEFGQVFQFPAGDQVELVVDGVDPAQGQDYVSFFPDGRTQPATITLSGLQGERVVVKCLSATEPFRVVPNTQ